MNMCLHLTRLSMIVLLQWKAAGRSALFIKKLHPNKASKTSFNLTFTQLMNSQTPKYYRSLFNIYSRVNMYNQPSFSCRIIKFQSRLFKSVLVLQVLVGPLAVVSCDTICLSFIQKNKNNELLRLINQVSQKGKRIVRICKYMKKFGETLECKQSTCLQVHKY